MVALAVVVVVSLVIVGRAKPAPAPTIWEEQPIIIGHVHPFTGGFSMFGTACATGIDVAIDEINLSGGVLGRPLKVINRDSRLSPEVGLREAKDLVLTQHVDFLMGNISSTVAAAISDFAKGQKCIYIITGSRDTPLTEEKGHRYVFRIGANTYSRVFTVASLAAEQWPGAKKVVMLNPDYEYGYECGRDFMEVYGKLVPGAELIYSDFPPLGTGDYTPYITKLMASDAEILFHAFYGGDYLTFTKQAVPAGVYDRLHVVGASCGGTETVCSMTKDNPAPIGEILSDEFPYWEIEYPEAKRVASLFMEKQAVSFGSYEACLGYTTVYAMKEAIEAAGAVDTEKIIDYLEGAEIDSPIGKVKIRAIDHQAMWPPYAGTMAFTTDYTWPHITNIWYPEPIESSYHTPEYIEAVRSR